MGCVCQNSDIRTLNKIANSNCAYRPSKHVAGVESGLYNIKKISRVIQSIELCHAPEISAYSSLSCQDLRQTPSACREIWRGISLFYWPKVDPFPQENGPLRHGEFF
jgi:hypothetical protein